MQGRIHNTEPNALHTVFATKKRSAFNLMRVNSAPLILLAHMRSTADERRVVRWKRAMFTVLQTSSSSAGTT